MRSIAAPVRVSPAADGLMRIGRMIPSTCISYQRKSAKYRESGPSVEGPDFLRFFSMYNTDDSQFRMGHFQLY